MKVGKVFDKHEAIYIQRSLLYKEITTPTIVNFNKFE